MYEHIEHKGEKKGGGACLFACDERILLSDEYYFTYEKIPPFERQYESIFELAIFPVQCKEVLSGPTYSSKRNFTVRLQCFLVRSTTSECSCAGLHSP